MGESSSPGLNPLSIPWGQKPKSEPQEKAQTYLGLRNEIAKDHAGADRLITIKARGVAGVPDGTFQLTWAPGRTLQQYLAQLKLVAHAMRSSLRDESNPSVGRLKMHYVPEEGAVIVLGNPAVSSALQFQRTSHNAEQIARKMGRGAKIVEVPLARK